MFSNILAPSSKEAADAAPVVAALFGLGRIGTVHLSNIVNNDRIVIKYIVDEHVERFDEFRRYWKLGDEVEILPLNESGKIYVDVTVDVVIISSPISTHQEIILNAIANNKDVFCEKPIAGNIDDINKCYEAAEDKGRILFSAFNRRFDPAFSGLRNRVRKGAIGHVQILKVTSRCSPLPPIEYLRTSGGVFHDFLVDDFDMSCWVLGDLPICVQASAFAFIPETRAIDDFDTIAYLLTFPSGAVALGDNSRFSAYGYDQRLEAFGNKGMVKVDNERPCHSTEVIVDHQGVNKTPIYYSFASRYKQAYQNELKHFLDVVQYGAPMVVTRGQALAVSKIATAAEESVRTGRTVHIDWGDIPQDVFS